MNEMHCVCLCVWRTESKQSYETFRGTLCEEWEGSCGCGTMATSSVQQNNFLDLGRQLWLTYILCGIKGNAIDAIATAHYCCHRRRRRRRENEILILRFMLNPY